MKQKVKDILREHVEQHEYSVDPEEIFEGVLGAIKKEKKDKKRYLLGFLIFFGFSIFLILQFVTLDTDFSNNSDSDTLIGEVQDAQVETIKADIPEQEESIPQSNSLKAPAKSSLTISEESSNSLVKENSDLKKEITEIKSLKQSIENSTQKSFKSKSTAKKSLLSNQNIDGVNQNKSRTNNLASGMSPLLMSANKHLRKADKESTKEKDKYSSAIITSDEKSNGIVDVSENQNKRDDVAVLNPSSQEINGSRNVAEILITLKPLLSKLTIEDRLLILEESMAEYLTEVESKLAKRKFALSVMGSYGLFNKDFVAKEEAYLAYANARDSYEKELEVLSAKLMLSYKISDKFKLSSGIKYQRFNEQFSWDGNYFIDAFGEQIDVNADNLVGLNFYQEVEREINVYNTHEVISVPLLFGLFHENKNISFGLNVGPSFEFYSSSKGQSLGFVSQSLNTMNIPIDAQDQLTQFGLGLEANIEFGLYLGKRIELLADFSAQRLLSTEQYLSLGFNSLSFGLGLRKTI